MGRPRKIKDKIGMGDSYAHLYKDISRNPIERASYLAIVNGFFKYMMQRILNGDRVMLPLNLGVMYIRGRKVKPRLDKDGNVANLSINWVKTKALRESCPECAERRQLVYNLNEHTNSIMYAFKWAKANVRSENISLYSFILSRTNKRAIHSNILAGKEYVVEKK